MTDIIFVNFQNVFIELKNSRHSLGKYKSANSFAETASGPMVELSLSLPSFKFFCSLMVGKSKLECLSMPSFLQVSLMLVGNVGSLPAVRFFTLVGSRLTKNNRLARINLLGTNTLAYFVTTTITKKFLMKLKYFSCV